MKRFLEIYQGKFSDLLEFVEIDSPKSQKAQLIYDIKEKYFTKGKPDRHMKYNIEHYIRVIQNDRNIQNNKEFNKTLS